MKLLIRNFVASAALLCLLCPASWAQNWLINIQDNAAGTPTNQVNGIMGGTATLYADILNFTGTAVSDDGTGSRAPATLLDFAGFGFTQNPGEDDIGSLFTPNALDPGYPQVGGSTDGFSAGFSGTLPLGTFDLSTLAPGIYHEDFTAGVFADDINSTVPFDDFTGTLTLQVNAAPVPEVSTWQSLGALLLSGGLLAVRRSHRKRGY